MRIGNGAQPRCSGNNLRGEADALRGREGRVCGRGEGSAYAPAYANEDDRRCGGRKFRERSMERGAKMERYSLTEIYLNSVTL